MTIRANITFRPHSWINLKDHSERFGIQAKIAGRRGWMHVSGTLNGKPNQTLIYDTANGRDHEMSVLRGQEKERRKAEVVRLKRSQARRAKKLGMGLAAPARD